MVRIVAIDHLEALFIVIPVLAGGSLALWLGKDQWGSWSLCCLCPVQQRYCFIGGVGLLFLPSIALLIAAVIRSSSRTDQLVPHPQLGSNDPQDRAVPRVRERKVPECLSREPPQSIVLVTIEVLDCSLPCLHVEEDES
ncbi:MAG: hypothetical protein M3Q20_03590 [Actinomycetota bacterium]|nr:hypothetical protein [Actinomycetota bacterium]